MTERENRPNHEGADRPASGGDLPPELVEAIKDQEYACVTAPSDHGTVIVAKVPGHELERLRGPMPIMLQHELYQHPLAPVIRTVVVIYDRPQAPLALETFTNVADPQQRADFSALASQTELDLLFYDEALAHRLSKRVLLSSPETIAHVVSRADQLLAAIPASRLDFNRAKADVMRQSPWPPVG